MTRTSKALAVLSGLGMVFAIARGGQCVNEARWLDAAAEYALAALLLAGMLRELSRTQPGDYTDDLDTPGRGRQAKPVGKLRAARAARREVRATGCGCNLYWTTAGAEHDDWCPQRRWSFT
ncbi:hypothetical protein DI272_19110 [Streptomyces sp. Act143]|uniref:hypothetical protein n=1 Tax=Streptomyces sp. Act143 TaxID=2200760 RepID=UPI000D679D64|nr:hypothetical protein [Streptomyces sp. Act143]PWI16042.1 hypothetical protein DI272_19110 [Streptomyces sp. Act143]